MARFTWYSHLPLIPCLLAMQLAPIAFAQSDDFKSQSLGGAAQVVFHNKPPRAVDMYWVDFEGKHVHYGELDAGGRHEQETGVGHAWVFKANGKEVARFVAKSGLREFNIQSEKELQREMQDRSLPDGAEVSVNVKNETPSSINVIWVNFEGKDIPSGKYACRVTRN